MKRHGYRCSRRGFLGGAAASLAAPLLIPRHVLGDDNNAPANEKIVMGAIGIGKMLYGSHLPHFVRKPEVKMVAVCDVDTTRREAGKKRVDDEYKNTDCAAYVDYRELIARKDIDAIVCATPDHWHSLVILEACKAGKDIYCEKPLTNTITEAKVVMDAVKASDIIFQTGSQQRSGAEFRQAAQLVRNGKIGKIEKVIVNIGGPSRWCDLPTEEAPKGLNWEMWLGPAPYRGYNSQLSPKGIHNFYPWRDYREYSGGMTTDWGAHHYDITQWALGMDDSGPVKFVPPADKNATSGIKFYYANGVVVQHGGDNTLERDGRKESFGIQFIGTEGRIYVDRGRIGFAPEEIEDIQLTDNDIKLYESNNHQQDWFNCIREHKLPICDVEIGCRSVSVCHLCNIAYWTNKEIHWDPKREIITNNEEANALLSRKQRAPYCDWV